jgi:hypothetical protein
MALYTGSVPSDICGEANAATVLWSAVEEREHPSWPIDWDEADSLRSRLRSINSAFTEMLKS